MLLVDTIQSRFGASPFKQTVNGAALIEAIKASQKFVVDHSFAVAADTLPDEEVARIIPHALPPFDICWFEVEHQYRPAFLGAETTVGTLKPQRVGILIYANADDLRRYIIHLFWRFHKHSFAMSPVAVIMDLHEEAPYREDAKTEGMHGLKLEVASRCEMRLSPLLKMPKGPPPQDMVNEIIMSQAGNWGGEIEFWSGVLALLSCRNAAEIENIEPRRFGAASSRQPMSGYRLCKIKLAASRGIAVHAVDGDHRDLRAHFVRGHFKKRKTGLFWWSPYVRGDKALGFIQKDYRLSA